MKKILFIDRDGTIIIEPSDKQIDSLAKLSFVPDVIPSLISLRDKGFKFVIVSNQDGLGTQSFLKNTFEAPHNKMLEILSSQGIEFESIKICPHFSSEACRCRKPQLGLVTEFLRDRTIDWNNSFVIGDRSTDIDLAHNMGIPGFQITNLCGWKNIVNQITLKNRYAKKTRITNETNVVVSCEINGNLVSHIQTGLKFFDHMLDQVAKHSGIALNIVASGDLEVDEHHLVEDVAITLGQVLKEALGDKIGINRFGFFLPMDDCAAKIAIDLSGRSYCNFKAEFKRDMVGDLPTEMVKHFYRSLADELKANITIELSGENDHHKIESSFKAFGRSLRQAVALSEFANELPSTKGSY